MTKNPLEAEVCRKYKTTITGDASELRRRVGDYPAPRDFSEMKRWADQFEVSLHAYLQGYGFSTINDLYTLMVKSEYGDGIWPPKIQLREGNAKCVLAAHDALYAFLSMAVLELYLDYQQVATETREALFNSPVGLDIFTLQCTPTIRAGACNLPAKDEVTYNLTLTIRYTRDLPTILSRLKNVTIEEM